MNAAAGPGLLYSGDREHWDLKLPQGVVCVRSLVSPDKETPNEDTAAVIPIGREKKSSSTKKLLSRSKSLGIVISSLMTSGSRCLLRPTSSCVWI